MKRIDDPPINVNVISDILSIDGSLLLECQEMSMIQFCGTFKNRGFYFDKKNNCVFRLLFVIL